MKTMTKTLVWLGISLFAATAWASGGFEIVKTVKISDAVARTIKQRENLQRVRFVNKNTIAAKPGHTFILDVDRNMAVLLKLKNPGNVVISKLDDWTKRFPDGSYVTYVCACDEGDNVCPDDDDCEFASDSNAQGCAGPCHCKVSVFSVDVDGGYQKVDTF